MLASGRSAQHFWARCPRCRFRHEQFVGYITCSRCLPWKSTQAHTAVDDGQRPNVDRARVIPTVVVDFRREVWIRPDDTCSTLALFHFARYYIPVALTTSSSNGYLNTTALPKSMIFIIPCSLITTLSSLRSRCAKPILWR